MVLSTHATVGGTLGCFIPNPFLAFLAGFLSHFILDAIPHWDYPLRSARKNAVNKLDNDIVVGRDFYLDLLKIGLDILVGFTLIYFCHLSFWAAVGAVAPDFLQFAYFKLRWRILRWLQAFHMWIHANRRLDDRSILGPGLQVLLIIIVLVIIKL